MNRGGVLIMTLVFVTMFLVMFLGLAGMVSRTYRQSVIQAHDELAFQIAEAGLNYGRWRLAHNSEDLALETKQVKDQFAGDLGSYDVSFDKQPGSEVVTITSVGRTASQPAREVILRARYGPESLARYVSIINEDVWFGGEIKGVVHANGGIRMDGESDSLMTSAKETYICQPHHGCSYEEKPGVWGSGEKEELWEFPVPAVDYNALVFDLIDLRDIAISSGNYFGESGGYGYHVIFNGDNTYDIYRVTSKGSKVWSWAAETAWQKTSHDIGSEVFVETRDIPSGGVLYFEDNLWVEGEIMDRITVAVGKFPDMPSTNVDFIINGNITYGGVRDGSRVFGAIAQRHVLIPWSGAPDELELDGAFVAQKGRFGRRYYPDCCGSQAHAIKNKLERFGMVASNMVPVTTWVNSSGSVVSGYREGEATYDPYLLYWPPPNFPTTGESKFISWEEVE